MTTRSRIARRSAVIGVAAALVSGCGFSPYDMPLPGGADTGDEPFTVTADFRDVLDLVPQSGVRVNDLPVGKVTDIQLDGWTAKVTLEVNGDVELPDNTVATIRQTSLLGEKFVSLAPPATGGVGQLGNGDHLALEQTGRNPEIEEVFSAASLLFNGGGLERTNTIVRELNATLSGNEPEIKELLDTTETFLGQLDDNKDALLTSLEQVNRLAIATNEQTDQITGALDTLPGALDVINDQRDDLVQLLQSLNDLGDVATDVIRESKDDTVANLKALTPILRNLATASDDFAYDFKALLSYPFTDGFVGGSFAKASGRCANEDLGTDANTGWCTGDFHNLSIRLQLGADQLANLLGVPILEQEFNALETQSADTGTDSLQEQISALTEQIGQIPVLGDLSRPPAESGAAEDPTEQPCRILLLFSCRTTVGGGPRDLQSVLIDSAEGTA